VCHFHPPDLRNIHPPLTTALPAPTKTIINSAVGKLLGMAAPNAWRWIRTKIWGSADDRALKRALRVALANSITGREDLHAIDLFERLTRPPFSGLIVGIIRQPTEPVGEEAIRAAFDAAGYDLGVAGIDGVELIRSIQSGLVSALRLDPDPQSKLIHLTTRAEEINAGQQEILGHVRALTARVDPALGRREPMWLPEAMRGLYMQSRQAFVEGRLEEAKRAFSEQLESAQHGELSPGRVLPPEVRTEWVEHGQNLLLSLAQVAILQDDRKEAASRVSDARALAPFTGRTRYFAGWVLANLGRMRDARAVLEPPDGTHEWNVLLAVVYLSMEEYQAFREIIPSDEDIHDLDVFLSLIQYHIANGGFSSAESPAKALLRRPLSSAADLVRAAEACVLILGAFAIQPDPSHDFDTEFWVAEARRLIKQSEAHRDSMPRMLARSLAWQKYNLHRLLLEEEPTASAFDEIVAIDLSGAAHIAAAGMYMPDDPDLLSRLGDATDNPITRGVLEAARLQNAGELLDAIASLARVRVLAHGEERERIVAYEVELRAQLGESRSDLIARLETELPDARVRGPFVSALLQRDGCGEEALELMDTLRAEAPADLRLLRTAFSQTIAVVRERRGQNAEAGELGRRAVDLAEELVTRLPCPEHRIRLATALAVSDDEPKAYQLLQSIEESGYRTRTTAGMIIDLTRSLHRLREHADALERFAREFEPTAPFLLKAAHAAVGARDYERARFLVEEVLVDAPAEIAEQAFLLLSHITLIEASGDLGARERAARVLVEGYDKIGASKRLAGSMFFQGLHTGLEQEIAERIGRDFGSLSELPGMTPYTVEEFIEFHEAGKRQAHSAERLFSVGAIPFETYAGVHGEVSFVWFFHRVQRKPLTIAPPRLERQQSLPESPPPLLIDITALLCLAETGILEVVLTSDLDLWVESATLQWLRREELRLRSRFEAATDREGIREQLAILTPAPGAAVDHVDTELLEILSEAFGARAEEAALAIQNGWLIIVDDVDDDQMPGPVQGHTIRSQSILDRLVDDQLITYAEAGNAAATLPAIFASRRGSERRALDRPILLTADIAAAWHRVGLLAPLAAAAPATFLAPSSRSAMVERLQRLDAYDSALKAVEGLRSAIEPAVESERVRVIRSDPAVGIGEHDDDEKGGQDHEENDAGAVLAHLTAPVEHVYDAAAEVGGWVWADDPAIHLYSAPIGAFRSDLEPLRVHAMQLHARHASTRVVGTPQVLEWLDLRGLVPHERRLEILEDLAVSGRLLLVEPDLIGRAAYWVAEARDSQERGQRILDALTTAHSALSAEAAARASSELMSVIARAVIQLWSFEDAGERTGDTPTNREKVPDAARLVIRAVEPWTSRFQPFGAFTARAFWLHLGAGLVPHVLQNPEGLVSSVLDAASGTDSYIPEAFLGAWVSFSDYVYGVERESRPLWILLMDRLAAATDGRRVQRRQVLPDNIARLAMESLGVSTSGRNIYGGTRADGSKLYVVVDKEDSESMTAALLENAHNEATAGGHELDLGMLHELQVEVAGEVLAADPEQHLPVTDLIDPLFLLRRVSHPVRHALLRAREEYHRATGSPELAEILARYRERLDAGSDGAAPDTSVMLREVLEAPRTWLSVDVPEFFERLYGSSISQLRAMLRNPPHWLPGQQLMSWLEGAESVGYQERDALITTFWGPFEAPLRAVYQVAEQPNEEIDAGRMKELLEVALRGKHPYSRIFSMGLLLEILGRQPELGASLVDVAEIVPAGELDQAQVWSTEEIVRALVSWRLRSAMTARDYAETETLTQGGPIPEQLYRLLDVVLAGEEELIRLHTATARLVNAVVWSPRHVHEIAIEEHAIRRGGTEMDPVGELLLLGQMLVENVFVQLMETAEPPEWGSLAEELEQLEERFPFHEAAGDPRGDQHVPGALGRAAPRADPVLTTLLALLQQTSSLPSGPPIWCSVEAAGALGVISAREPTQASRHLESLATQPGVENRLGSLMGQSAERRAAPLLGSLN
jgi:hypothetical protein